MVLRFNFLKYAPHSLFFASSALEQGREEWS